MSLQMQIGPWKMEWKKTPVGNTGSTEASLTNVVTGEKEHLAISWLNTDTGINLCFNGKIYEFEIRRESHDDGTEYYRTTQSGSIPMSWLVNLNSESTTADMSSGKKLTKTAKVRAQMPGKVTKVLVTLESTVKKGEPVAVMEAMKMENEIRAPISGKVIDVRVVQGQTVESGAELFRIEPL